MNARLHEITRSQTTWIAVAIGLALAGLCLVEIRSQIHERRYELAQLEQQERELRSEIEKLRRKVAVLSAPSRIERLARHMGMEYPEAGALVSLPERHGDLHLAAAKAGP